MIIIRTHLVETPMAGCARCGLEIPVITREEKSGERVRVPLMGGDKVGIIESHCTPPSGYLITQPEHDSNEVCR